MRENIQGPIGPVLEIPLTAWRSNTALVLTRISIMLRRVARAMQVKTAQTKQLRRPELEFYAEAGAPEGALYLDGELIGHLPGITRL